MYYCTDNGTLMYDPICMHDKNRDNLHKAKEQISFRFVAATGKKIDMKKLKLVGIAELNKKGKAKYRAM